MAPQPRVAVVSSLEPLRLAPGLVSRQPRGGQLLVVSLPRAALLAQQTLAEILRRHGLVILQAEVRRAGAGGARLGEGKLRRLRPNGLEAPGSREGGTSEMQNVTK